MLRNVTGQKIAVFAFDITTGAAKTGDSANLTLYVNKDYAGVNALVDTGASEINSTSSPGWYVFDLTASETDAVALLFTGKSSTASVSLVGQLTYTTPANYTSLSIDSNGRVDVIKLAGTTQTARDIGASVLLSSGTGTGQLSITSGIAKVDVDTIKTNPVVNGGTVTFTTNSTVASTTNITAGTITTVTNLTNAPTAGDLTATMKSSVTTAATAATPTVTAGTVSDKTGYALTSGERNSVADALLNRDLSTGTDDGSSTVRTVRQALRFLRNKWAIAAGTLTVYKEDDSTSSWTSSVATTAGDPVSSSDPAGP